MKRGRTIVAAVLAAVVGKREEWLRKGTQFLKGALPDKRVRLREFALCYPRCKIQRFTKRGVGLMVKDLGYDPDPDHR
jgi:hypothetical protein